MNQWEKSILSSFRSDIRDYSDELLEELHVAIALENQRRTEIARDLFEKALKGE